MFISSKFDITPIKSKICNFTIIDKEIINEIINDNIKHEDSIISRIIKISNINSSFSEINYFDKLYKIKLYENTSHIIAYICEEVEEYQIKYNFEKEIVTNTSSTLRLSKGFPTNIRLPFDYPIGNFSENSE